MAAESLRERHRVTTYGEESRPAVVLVHGYGCDQTMWRHLVPYLEDDYRVVSYDQAGAAGVPYDVERYASLDGYADDLVAICGEIGLEDVVVVGHSIASMIGVRAHLQAPRLVTGLVMISPSPRFVDAPPYLGGFSRDQVEDILRQISTDYDDWARTMAPVFMGSPDRPELAGELADAFLRTDPRVAQEFARVTFLSDNRDRLPEVHCPALVVQGADDPLAAESVGQYVHALVDGSSYTKIDAAGHFVHVSAPEDTARAILAFLGPIRSFLRRTRG